jgi:HPt (histidine-containing phosphotransfer) domain-containing protein
MAIDSPDVRILDGSALGVLRQLQEPGAPDVVSEMLRMFFEDSAKRLASAAEAVASGDAQQLQLLAHQLRAGAALIGAERVAQIAWQIELAAKIGRTHSARALVHRLADAIQLTRATVAQFGLGGSIREFRAKEN